MYGITDGYIFNVTNVNSDLESAIIDASRANKIALVYKWTGNLTGTLEVWASNNDLGGIGIGFFKTDATFDTNLNGTPDIAEQELDAPNKYYMIKLNHTVATSGNLYMNATTRLDRLGVPKSIALFANGVYTGASAKSVDFNGWVDFGSGVAPVIIIDGRKYIQMEEAFTNLGIYSQQFDNGHYIQTRLTGVTANATTAPDGTATADKVVENTTTSNSHYLHEAQTPDGSSTYLFSVYVKAAEREWIALGCSADGFPQYVQICYNVSTGVVGTVRGGPVAYGIYPVTNGFYRCWFTATSDAAASTDFRIYLASADDTVLYDGDGTSGVYVWQRDYGIRSQPTSPVLTTTTPATRAKDEFYWASADVPDALRGDINYNVIHCGSNELQETGNRYYINFVESGASEEIDILYSRTSYRTRVLNVTTSTYLITASSVTFDGRSIVTHGLRPSAGELIISNAITGDGTHSGTPWATSTGNVWVMSREDANMINGWFSEPY